MATKRATSAPASVRQSAKKSVAGRRTADELRANRHGKRTTRPSRVPATGVDEGTKGTVIKVIRDSFTMPAGDYELIAALKNKCISLGVAIKKSELLRAGLHALRGMADDRLAQVVAAVESVKTGRPPGHKKRKKTSRVKAKKR